MRTDEWPSLAPKTTMLALTKSATMEKAGTEHEVMAAKALGRSNKLLLGNFDASSRGSPHIVSGQGHVTYSVHIRGPWE